MKYILSDDRHIQVIIPRIGLINLYTKCSSGVGFTTHQQCKSYSANNKQRELLTGGLDSVCQELFWKVIKDTPGWSNIVLVTYNTHTDDSFTY